MVHDDIREQLIRQFPAEVIETTDADRKVYYACPTCKRAVSIGMDKCAGCTQVLSWENICKEKIVNGAKTAVLKFEVPADFRQGDCRKCPLSFIGKENKENVYECPLRMRANCKLEIL